MSEYIKRILDQVEGYPTPAPEGMIPAFDYQIRSARKELADLEADLRRAREEGSKRMTCGHLQADWVAHNYSGDLSGGYCRICAEQQSKVSSVTDAIKEALRILTEAKSWGAALGAVTEDYPWLVEGLQKVREEATVAAAGAQREAAIAIVKYWVEGSASKSAQHHASLIIHALEKAPLVTSPEGEKWLRERDGKGSHEPRI